MSQRLDEIQHHRKAQDMTHDVLVSDGITGLGRNGWWWRD